MISKIIYWCLVVGALSSSIYGAHPKYEASKQVLSILNDPESYDKYIIPFQNRSGPLKVSSTIFMRSIDIDDVNMRTDVELTFRMSWKDIRLSYNSPVPSVRFSDSSKFWIPDAFFKNSFQTKLIESIYPETYVEVASKGNILYSSRFIVNLRCEMDLRRFPHDTQECPIYIASYGYSTKDVMFHFEENKPLSTGKNMVLSNRFFVDKLTTGSCSSITSTGEYSCLKILFNVNRIFTGYLLEWYLPCIFLVVIAFFSEFLDVSVLLPRLVLTVGPLLTLTAASLSYSQSLPSVPYSTALDVFTGISLLAIFCTVLHILISYYYHNQPAEEKVEVDVSTSKWKRFCSKIKEKGNQIAKWTIIAFYAVFVFLYFLAYIM
ncbi:Glutamate-gated chloride channel [Armadillidium nasatum]|uniref:Glutamate-gated chloride channel n=1 Tax=Armadillidium nasatum TaxID=96803 RepID=A0A5N5STG7_9CRUS|nr:Glutamate-gated chloride channel [Armadillidium nasatum]